MAHFEFHETVEARGGAFPLRGTLRRAFRAGVRSVRRELHASRKSSAPACSVVLDGETVVDLWGGWARADHSRGMGRALDRLHDERRQGRHRHLLQHGDRPRADRPGRAHRHLLARVRAEREAGHPRAHGARPHRGDPGADRRRDVSGRVLRLRRPTSARSRCSTRCGSRAPAPPTTSTTRASCSARSCAG